MTALLRDVNPSNRRIGLAIAISAIAAASLVGAFLLVGAHRGLASSGTGATGCPGGSAGTTRCVGPTDPNGATGGVCTWDF